MPRPFADRVLNAAMNLRKRRLSEENLLKSFEFRTAFLFFSSFSLFSSFLSLAYCVRIGRRFREILLDIVDKEASSNLFNRRLEVKLLLICSNRRTFLYHADASRPSFQSSCRINLFFPRVEHARFFGLKVARNGSIE